jgi:hypothetical protein
VLRGGRSFGIARHWHPVVKIYMIPFFAYNDVALVAAAPGRRINSRPFVVGNHN